MNSVHEHHRAAEFAQLRHYVFAFHDSTFECVARDFTTEDLDGPMTRVVVELARALDPR